MIRATYDAAALFAAVAVECFQSNGDCGGHSLARRLLNRTFELETGMAFIDAVGVRNLDQDVFAYDTVSRRMLVSF